MQTAVERWQEMLDARAAQMDAAYAQLGRTSADFWDRRARNFHRATKESVARDPLFLHVQPEVTSQNSVLDVGAGTGRFALALAPQVQHVTAVEPNAAMLDYLRRDAAEQGLSNISYMQTSWQDAPTDLHAPISFSVAMSSIPFGTLCHSWTNCKPLPGRHATSTCGPRQWMPHPTTSGNIFTAMTANSNLATSMRLMYCMRWEFTRTWKLSNFPRFSLSICLSKPKRR